MTGCRSDDECPTTLACINGRCQSPCKCGLNAVCEVLYHKALCKCLPGYNGNAAAGCQGKYFAFINMGTITRQEDNFMGKNKKCTFWPVIYSLIFFVHVDYLFCSAHIKSSSH